MKDNLFLVMTMPNYNVNSTRVEYFVVVKKVNSCYGGIDAQDATFLKRIGGVGCHSNFKIGVILINLVFITFQFRSACF